MRLSAVPLIFAAALSLGCDSKEETEYVYGTSDASPYLKGQNIIYFHATASQQDPADCMGCHGDMSNETSLAEGTQAYHPMHASNTSQYTCVTCHTSVDLLERSGTSARKQAGPTLCASCHGPNGLSSKKLYMSE